MPEHARRRNLKIEGTLEAWTPEIGEPLLWVIHETDRPGPEGVHPLLNGDLLVVDDWDGTPIWIGTIDFDFEAGLRQDPADPSSMRQAIAGYWVHGFQTGEDPELWARMFFEHRHAVVKRRHGRV